MGEQWVADTALSSVGLRHGGAACGSGRQTPYILYFARGVLWPIECLRGILSEIKVPRDLLDGQAVCIILIATLAMIYSVLK